MKAILIDDELLALQGLKMELESSGQVEVDALFQDPSQAIAYLRHQSADVIFLDIEMPEMNGLELFSQIIELQSDVHIVFVTAFREYAVEAYELNALDYLVKPVQRDRLAATLKRIKAIPKTTVSQQLEIRCFGHFSIYHNGQDINVNWRTRKAEELLAYLICNKGSYVSKEKIADALWPDLDGDKSMANLYLAYYYVKKMKPDFGVALPVQSARGKMRFDMNQVKCDLMDFIRLSEELGFINEANLELANQALDVSSREPFEDSYFPWLVDYQQKFERMRTDIKRRVDEYHNSR